MEDFREVRGELKECAMELPKGPNVDMDVLTRFQLHFSQYVPPLLKRINDHWPSAEKKLQFAMMIPFSAICEIAGSLSDNEKVFQFSMEPLVSLHPQQVSDIALLELRSRQSSPTAGEQEQMVALVELKPGNFPVVRSSHFAQLFHAAALAYNSGMWKERLLCCLASLRYWHLFIVELSTTSSGVCFIITQYYQKFCDYSITETLLKFYSDLVLSLSSLILRN